MKYPILFFAGIVIMICSVYVSAQRAVKPKANANVAIPLSKQICTILPDTTYSFLPDSLRHRLKFFFMLENEKSTQYAISKASNKALLKSYFGGDVVKLHTYKDDARKWNKTVLVVSFVEGGHLIERERVKKAVKQWEACCNIYFSFVQTLDADITVSFEGGVNQSYIGRECKYKRVSTWLNVGPYDSDEEYNRVVLHEFGHAMGFVHEHQVDDGNPLVWDTAEVISFYAQPPNNWDSAKTMANVIVRLSKTSLNGTAYDAHSIMCYEVPAGLLKNHPTGLPANTQLSDSDKAFAARVYR